MFPIYFLMFRSKNHLGSDGCSTSCGSRPLVCADSTSMSERMVEICSICVLRQYVPSPPRRFQLGFCVAKQKVCHLLKLPHFDRLVKFMNNFEVLHFLQKKSTVRCVDSLSTFHGLLWSVVLVEIFHKGFPHISELLTILLCKIIKALSDWMESACKQYLKTHWPVTVTYFYCDKQ